MNISKGKIQSAQKVVLYGPEGIGKSTFAAQFPDPLFIDTEGSTKHLDVRRFDPPTSWAMLREQVLYVVANPDACKTLVVDTADWADRLCVEHVCAQGGYTKTGKKIESIEDFGYGKGFTIASEEFGRLLNALSEVVNRGIHVLLTAHARIQSMDLPDEMGSYNYWGMKMSKHTSPLVKEWADLVLFANYKTLVVNVDNQGAAKGKNKAQGGQRVMYTSHRPTWDAKNRHGLPDELPLEFAQIAHVFAQGVTAAAPMPSAAPPAPQPPASAGEAKLVDRGDFDEIVGDGDIDAAPAATATTKAIHPKLLDLMAASKVYEGEIQAIVGDKGWFPENMPVADYSADFVEQMLIPEWSGKVKELILEYRQSLPFK